MSYISMLCFTVKLL